MKKHIYAKKFALGALAATVALSCTACGSTFAENTSKYFENTAQILNTMFSSGNTNKKTPQATESGSELVKLETPGSFTLSEDGKFSFTGVENADHYLIYLCDPSATDDGADFLYSSEPITEDGSGTYSGTLSDIAQYAYGEYLVKVYAFPALMDTQHDTSGAASASFTYTGNQSNPNIAYCWDTFTGAMNVQVSNLDVYQFEAYPNQVDVTFTNVADESDTVTVTIQDVSPENYSGTTDQLTRGEIYRVTAVSTSNSDYVLNPTTQAVEVVGQLVAGESNVLGGSYLYEDPTGSFEWPYVCENFNLAAGGNMGDTLKLWGEEPLSLEATPAAASDGAVYSYDIMVMTVWQVPGTMHLYADGTFSVSEVGAGPILPTSVKGTWVDNGDGTATLSYDHTSFVDG